MNEATIEFLGAWQPIKTAPKDGTPILTDDGIVSFCPDYNGWYLCYMHGHLINDSEDGPLEANPIWWMMLPKLPSKQSSHSRT